MAVLGYHFFPEIVPGGFVGVDVFFVISGYVITNLLLRQQPLRGRALALFWGHRVRRLFPALALVLAATLIAGWFILWPAQFDALGQATAWSAGMLGNVFAFRETGYFAAEPTWNPLLNMWSLGVEEQFYLVWPLLLSGLWLLVRGRRRALGLLLAVLGLGSWLWAASYGSDDVAGSGISAVFYLPWFRAWELLAGALIALVLLRAPTFATAGRSPLVTRGTAAIYWLSLAALPVALVWPYEDPRPTSYATVAVVLTAAVIALGAGIKQADPVVGNPVLLGLGRISYPLYLWHWPVLALALAAGLAESSTQRLLLVLLSIALATATWWLLEKPVQARPVTWRLVTLWVSVMVIIGVAGAVAARASMTRVNLDDVAGQLAAFSYDTTEDYGAECFIEGGDGQAPGDLVQCLPAEGQEGGVLVWGDSHAASMMAGIRGSLPNRTITQLTNAGCEPSLPQDAPGDPCVFMADLALEAIEAGRFGDVILAGWWRDQYDPQDLVRLVRHINEVSDATVTVVGPLPRWSPALPRVWSPDEIAQMSRLPLYTRTGLMDEPYRFDAEFRVALKGLDVTYVSPLDALCRADGCRVSVDGTPATLTAWDYGHLTRAGSELLGPTITAGISQRDR